RARQTPDCGHQTEDAAHIAASCTGAGWPAKISPTSFKIGPTRFRPWQRCYVFGRSAKSISRYFRTVEEAKLKKFIALCLVAFACAAVLLMPRRSIAANDEAEIRQLLDRWAKAFAAKDLNGIMSIYEPGQALVAYDIVPPLQYKGLESYKKDYQDFLEAFQGAIGVE